MRRERITVALYPWQIKKLDNMARRFWPSLNPKKCRSSVLRVLCNSVDARSTIAPRFKRKPDRRSKSALRWGAA